MIIKEEYENQPVHSATYRQWIKFWKKIPLLEVEKTIKEIESKYSPASYNIIISVLNKYFNYDRKFKVKKVPKRLPKTKPILSNLELRAIEQLMKKKYVPLFQLLKTTGLRISDGMNLDIAKMEVLENECIITQQKTQAQLKIRFLKGFDWQNYQKPTFTEDSFRKELRRIGTLLGIKNLTPHVLRHTFAYYFYKESGYDPIATQQVLGHKSQTTTLLYLQNHSLNTRESLRKLEHLFNDDVAKKLIAEDLQNEQKKNDALRFQIENLKLRNDESLKNIGRNNKHRQYILYLQRILNVNKINYIKIEDFEC